jgi:hypothetical protein
MTAPTIERDCFLYVSQPTAGIVIVYRSALVEDTDDIYQPVLEIVGDAEPLTRTTVSDDGMMFGSAEMLIYKVSR